ncbi:phage holin family protein [Pseudomonas stutzeri]|nr:phage holin family protein [Stutzerimonas degradans]
MDSLVLTQVTFWLCLVIFLRLFTYRRSGARFRRGVSLVAVLVMGCAGQTMISILQGALHMQPQSWPLVALLAVFTCTIWRARGNLAVVLKSESPRWDGAERRHGPMFRERRVVRR